MSAKKRRDGRLARQIQSDLGWTYTRALRFVRACLSESREMRKPMSDAEILGLARKV